MADELRPKPVPAPANGPGIIPQSQLPGEGRPPMTQNSVQMTDYTRRQLTAVGWQPGDPIPGDLGQLLTKVRNEIEAERASASLIDNPLAVGYKPVQASFVDIESLPPEKQQEIKQYLQDYKAEVNQRKEAEQREATIDAAIPANIQGPTRDAMREQMLQGEQAAAERSRQRRGEPATSYAIDDRKPAATPAGMPVPEGKTFAGTMGVPLLAEQFAKSQPVAAEPAPVIPAAEPLPTTGAVHDRTTCQRCAWPLAAEFIVTATSDDKTGFLAAFLGLGCFKKKYILFNGNLEVFFGSLTSEDTTVVQNQLGAMVRGGQIIGDGEYWANMHEFRLILSLDRLVVGGTETYRKPAVADLQQYAAEEVTPTFLPQLRTYFYEKAAKQESLRRVLGQTHQEFQRLVEYLEVMTSEPDFWIGIELRA